MSTTALTQGFTKKILSVLVALATALGMATIAVPNASADNRGILRPGCHFDSYQFYVQNCDVWSEAMGQNIKVQIKPAAFGGGAGLYLLDGMRARDDWNGWLWDGHAPDLFVNDDITLVMPVGGASQFYTDWMGPFGGNHGPKKPRWETFLTSELPAYLQANFGVDPHRNAVAGLSMGGTAAMNLAAWHRDQFKHASSFSGYLNPTWPGMYSAIAAGMVDVSGPGTNMWDMWGAPWDPARFRNDPTVQAGRFSGMPLYLSAAGGITGARENILANPGPVIAGVSLEWISRTSTAKFEMASRLTGAQPVVNYPITGIHAFSYWHDELNNARPHILRALGV